MIYRKMNNIQHTLKKIIKIKHIANINIIIWDYMIDIILSQILRQSFDFGI